MKIWLDNTFAPLSDDYVWCRTVNEAKNILTCVQRMYDIEVKNNLPAIDEVNIGSTIVDSFGGPFIEILKFIEKNGWDFFFCLHGHNVEENEQLLEIIRYNDWPHCVSL